MIGEILSEMGKEVAGSPVRMIAEVTQFLILIAIIWLVAFGFGKRRGFVTNMVAERRTRVQAELVEAQGATGRLEEATTAAQQREAAATKEAKRLVTEARSSAEEYDAQVRAEADAEAGRIVDRARTALVNERAQMQADVSEQLVDLVSQATRSIMNEKLTIVAGVAAAGKSDAIAKPRVRAKAPARAAAVGGTSD
jgi:F-type H+-transporting ATPase subunit b